MRADTNTVSETYINIEVTLDEARAVLDALSYFNTAVGGNNFEQGYGRDDAEDRRSHKIARQFQVLVDKMVIRAERVE